MTISACSLRRASAIPNPGTWTAQLLGLFQNLLTDALAGKDAAKKQLGDQLLYAQLSAYQNPFVSCSYEFAVAQHFALHNDTPGYVLTITGDNSVGLDFEDVRAKFGLFGDSMDYLKEYGIPGTLGPPFQLTRVELLELRDTTRRVIYP